ncbi:uncharacterized protein LOC133141573 [Conger conger]|uniref:uncharacterized protein LOC133141573 n=1 Tax=Conger conger TaxID=82655 RepID=UPI002A5AB9BA|nr:uncharacterized protein LOC133141573 [Conger conger]
MADHHQVKTSFLFIQLQAPSKACGPPHPANTACSGTAEEELSPRPASDGESLHHGSPTVSLPLNAPGSYTDAVSDRSREGTPESSVCPSDTSTGDATQVAGDPRNQESLCLSAERSDVVCEDAGNPDLETPVWILRQDTPESMSAEIGPLVAGMGVTTPAAPSSPGAQGRVSFLHPAGGSGASHKTPDCGVEKDAVGGSSQCVYPAPALSVACPPAPGADTAHWGEESSKQSKTFLSAVIERSAKIPGEPYRKNVDRSSSMSSPGPETSAAAKPAPELSPMASAEPWPPATDGPPPHRPPTAAQKAGPFVWVNSTSHAQSVAKAKYEFLFGPASADHENAHILPQGGSRETSAPSLQSGAADDGREDDFDETSLFLEIDRELAHLLRGLGGGGQDDPEHRRHPPEDAVPTTMIPCNGQSGAPPDPHASKPEKSGDSLLESGLVLEPWAEALVQNSVLPSSAAPGEALAHAAGVNGEARNVPSGPDALTDAPAPAAPVSGPGPGRAGPLGFGSHADGLLDQSLEESSKILAEIPGIFTAFLDGGQAKEKPHKKIRFAENRPESTQDQGRAGPDAPGTDVQVQSHGEAEKEGDTKGETSPDSPEPPENRPKSTNSAPSPLPQPGPMEDEVFQTVPEVCVESPESESTPELDSR